MNGILVLAMVPSIKSGVGPNFALPIGIVGGLFALMCCMQMDLGGLEPHRLLHTAGDNHLRPDGLGLRQLMNAVKGAEMTIATYTGFSIVAFFNILWLSLPFSNRKMGWMLGDGLRETIQMDGFAADKIVSNFLSFNIGEVTIPTGMILLLLLTCFVVSVFFTDQDRPRYLRAA